MNKTITNNLRMVLCFCVLAQGVSSLIFMFWRYYDSRNRFIVFISMIYFLIFGGCFMAVVSKLPNPTKPFGWVGQFALMFGVAFAFNMMLANVMILLGH